jgi:hypothetical protein
VRTGLILAALASVGLASACEKTIDPRTGDRNFQLSVPLTPEHGERLEQRWQECIRFRSRSICDERQPGGGRPTRGSARATPAESGADGPASADPVSADPVSADPASVDPVSADPAPAQSDPATR